ncbi:MAG: hypothetical protein R3C44_21240 [Chloroflexota bacterium]
MNYRDWSKIDQGLYTGGKPCSNQGNAKQPDRPHEGATGAGTDWRGLYRVGGIAPLIALLFYLSEVVAIILGTQAGVPFPTEPTGWLSLLTDNLILGLLYLNA